MNRNSFLAVVIAAVAASACAADHVTVTDAPEQVTQADAPDLSPQSLPPLAGRPSRYFVAFKSRPGQAERAAVMNAGGSVRREFAAVNAVAIEADDATVLMLAKLGSVAYIEEDPMRYKSDLSTSQLVPSMSNGLYGLVSTKATDSHAAGYNGAGIKVGIADTGLDCGHPDIAPRYKGGIDTIGAGDNDPCINDGSEQHGTHVAGTILGAFNNTGVYGVAYNADLYHARVLGNAGGSTSDIMEGVRWLVETAGVKVVNMSLGGRTKSRTEENFYKSMRSKGVLVVAATGNDGARSISYPAGYPVNVAVGAVDKANAIADFSNQGRNIDVVAPGVGVLSSVPRGQGSEASADHASLGSLAAYGMEFAGKTNGTTGNIVDCGLGQAGEFPASVANNVALIQRGTISFADKVTNAMAAGAKAVIIYNNVAGSFSGTLGAEGNWVPAVSVSDTDGAALKAVAGSSVTVINKVSDWDHYDGTSMATPHVTGVVALIWGARPGLTNSQVESALFSTCQDLGAAGYDTTYGNGLVNARAAITKALSL
jgi:subtilisin family serine protease